MILLAWNWLTDRCFSNEDGWMGLFRISRKWQYSICDCGQQCANSHMGRGGEHFHRKEKKFGRAVVKQKGPRIFNGWILSWKEMSLFSYWALLLLQDTRALPLVSQLYLTEDSIYYYYFLHFYPVIKIFFGKHNWSTVRFSSFSGFFTLQCQEGPFLDVVSQTRNIRLHVRNRRVRRENFFFFNLKYICFQDPGHFRLSESLCQP